jgi:hypothetical protein
LKLVVASLVFFKILMNQSKSKANIYFKSFCSYYATGVIFINIYFVPVGFWGSLYHANGQTNPKSQCYSLVEKTYLV